MLKKIIKSLFGTKIALALLACTLCLPISAQAQYSHTELDTLVASIALYPDPLLVQVLTASTCGGQIAPAARFAMSHRNLQGQALAVAIERANLSFDPSVQALIPFPDVLDMMARYGAWTNQLGEAMQYQKNDVLDAIQRLRRKAYNFGHLQTNEVVTVYADRAIAIQPTHLDYVFVPVYNPGVVYYSPARGRVYVNFGPGVLLGTFFGEWGWGSCWFDWGYRAMYVRNYDWYYHRDIPRHPRHFVPRHRGYGPPPGHRPAPAPAPRMAPRPAPAPHAGPRMAPRPAPAPAPAPAPRMAPAPRPAPAPAPAPAPRTAPAPRPRH